MAVIGWPPELGTEIVNKLSLKRSVSSFIRSLIQ